MTLKSLELMNQGRKDNLIAFFEKLNGISPLRGLSNPIFTTHYGTIKQAKIEEHAKRLRDFIAEDMRIRIQAKEQLRLEASANDMKKKRVRDCLASDTCTLYDILGVKHDASAEEIIKSFRDLSKVFHPDKCSDDDAKDVFQRLNGAKDTLCCELTRATYDDELQRHSKDD